MTNKLSLDRREMLKKAAVELAYQYGYEGTSMKQIAERCNVAVGLIYHHFKNKEELFKEALLEQGFLPKLEKILPEIINIPVEEGLVLLASEYIDIIRTHIELSVLVIESQHNTELRNIYTDIIKHGKMLIKKFFDAKISAGELSPCDSGIAVQMLFGHFMTAAIQKDILRMDHLPQTDDDFIKKSIHMFLAGWRERKTNDFSAE